MSKTSNVENQNGEGAKVKSKNLKKQFVERFTSALVI